MRTEYQDKSMQAGNNSFARPFLIAFASLLFCFTTLCGQTLENKAIRIDISPSGNLKTIYDVSLKHEYKLESDYFSVLTDLGSFSNKNATVLQTKTGPGWIAYYYQLTPSRTIKLEYTLKPEAAYLERSLTVSEGSEPLTLLSIEFGVTHFTNAPEEVIIYNTFWNASTVSFLRWSQSGLFSGVENPFFKTQETNKAVSFQYEPSLVLKPTEAHRCDPQFIGTYTKSGRQITDYYPQTVTGNNPRFRNPDGYKPLDLNEIKAMQHFVADYMDLSLNRFTFINYHFFFPLPQMPKPGSPDEKMILNVVNTFHKLGGDLFMFNPMYEYAKPGAADTSYWALGPEGSSAKKIMDKASALGIGSGYYMGCARYGLEGNAAALPFVPENKDWKKCDEQGNCTTENCMASDGFADWWFTVQDNTITKYKLKLWSWDPGPGNGKFCFNKTHGHLPGKGEYKGWRSSTELLHKLKEKHPDLFLMAFYGRKEYGLWGFKYFDQHESYWEETVPYQASIHPDLHADRVNADGIRLQSWWNQNFRFMPPQINHVLAHRIQEGNWDTRLSKAWDYNGWKYSVMSALACGGGIMTVILPDNVEGIPGMKAFYAKWLKWGRDNFHLAKYNIAFGEQLRVGGVDGWARIHKKNGFIFLCNQNPRPAKITFKLNSDIGLDDNGQYTLRESYPKEGAYFFDAQHPDGLFKHGDSITCVVPAYQVVLMELSAAGKVQPVIPQMMMVEADLRNQTNPRMLDHWKMKNGDKFNFPFNDSATNLVLTTQFFANKKIRQLLQSNRPKNLHEYESLIPKWKNDYPDNFAWTRPDRLWFVLPSVNASLVQDPH